MDKRDLAADLDHVQKAWEHAADYWDDFIASGKDFYRLELHGPALLEACENVAGLQVLDLGCGQGYFSRLLASRGARVTGIDISTRLVARADAYEKEHPLGIRYIAMDAGAAADHFPAESFDRVTACMSLLDMPHPDQVLDGCRRLLRAGGRVLASIPNPHTDTPYREWERDEQGRKQALRIDRYFESGQRTTQWRMQRLKHHWTTPYWYLTLDELSGMIADAGLLIRRIREPRPTEEQVRRNPELDDCRRLPYFLILDLLKA